MGRKGGQRSRRHTVAGNPDDEVEDVLSVTSHDTNDTYGSGVEAGGVDDGGQRSETSSNTGGGGLENGSQAIDDFKDAVEKLTEKRAGTRESGLQTVISFMLHSPDLNPVIMNQETLLQSLIAILRRKGTESEGVHALRALSVLCVCIGPEEEDVFRSLRRPLRTLITRSRYPGVRAAATNTLSLACFICSSDDDHTSEMLDFFAEVFSRTSDGLEVPDKLVAAALSGWGLLATTVSRSWVATKMTTQHLRVFRDLLMEGDMDVRIEAGENLALLHESRLIVGLSDGSVAPPESDGGEEEGNGEQEDADEGDGDEEGGSEELALDLTSLWDEIVEEMKGFITDSSKKLSRETKKQQRRTFRQLFSTVGENEPPEEVVSLQNGSLMVRDWAHIKQLNALRACLKSGFQTQMQSNDLLREILGVSKWGGTAGEKPFYSKNSLLSKQQTTSRTRSRHSKQLAQDEILSDVGGR